MKKRNEASNKKYSSSSMEKQPDSVVRKPKTRRVLVAIENATLSDGKNVRAFVMEDDEVKDVDFLKLHRRNGGNAVIYKNRKASSLWTYIQDFVAYDNSVQLPIPTVCREMEMSEPTLRAAIKDLVENDYVKETITPNLYMVNPWKVSSIKAVNTGVLETAWYTRDTRQVRDKIAEMEKQRRKTKQEAVAVAEPVIAEPAEPVVEPVRERYNGGGEQMLITDVVGLTPSLEEQRKMAVQIAVLDELRRQRNREKQRRFRERQRGKAAAAASIPAPVLAPAPVSDVPDKEHRHIAAAPIGDEPENEMDVSFI